MKQKFLFLLAAVVALALGSCTIDDEIESVHTERLAGYWYSEVIRSGKTANLLTEDEGDMVRMANWKPVGTPPAGHIIQYQPSRL